MIAPRVSEATVDALRFVSERQAGLGATSYQLDRHVLNAHGPVASREVYRELAEFELAETAADETGVPRWRLTTLGRKVLLESGTK